MVNSTERSFGPQRTEVRAARLYVRAVLTEWGLSFDEVEMIVGELAANAVVHAQSAFEVRLHRSAGGTVDVVVSDGGSEWPDLPAPDPAATAGRGLQIVDHLAEGWGIEPRASGGKTVWVQLKPPRSLPD